MFSSDKKKAKKVLNYDEDDQSRFRHIDYESKQIYLVFALMIGIIVGLFFFIGASAPAQNTKNEKMDILNREYLNGTINGEEYRERLDGIENQYELDRKGADQFIIYYSVGYLMIFAGSLVKIAFAQKDYEKEQGDYDSFEGPVTIDPFDTARYLIQTQPDSKTKIRTKKDMVRVLEKTEVFSTIVKSIEGDFDRFKFDKGDILKHKFSKDSRDMMQAQLKEEITEMEEKGLERDGLLSNMFGDEDLTLRYKHHRERLIDSFGLKDLFSEQQYEMLEDETLYLYYRPVENIYRLDDTSVDPFSPSDMAEDRFGGIKGFIYLLPMEEQDYYAFRSRTSPLENVALRKAYFSWRFRGMFLKQIPFFVPNSLFEEDKKLNEKTTQQAHIKALTFLSHLAIDKDEELRKEIQDLRVDNIDLETQLDKKRDRELTRMIHNGELENSFRSRFEKGKINATAVLIGIFSLIVGMFINFSAFGGG